MKREPLNTRGGGDQLPPADRYFWLGPVFVCVLIIVALVCALLLIKI